MASRKRYNRQTVNRHHLEDTQARQSLSRLERRARRAAAAEPAQPDPIPVDPSDVTAAAYIVMHAGAYNAETVRAARRVCRSAGVAVARRRRASA